MHGSGVELSTGVDVHCIGHDEDNKIDGCKEKSDVTNKTSPNKCVSTLLMPFEGVTMLSLSGETA